MKILLLGPSCSMRTDRRYEANSRLSQFCENAQKFEAFEEISYD